MQVTEAAPLTAQHSVHDTNFNQTNPESSQHSHQKTQDQIEASAADLEIPDPPQHSLTKDEDEPMAGENLSHFKSLTLDKKKELLNKYDLAPHLKVGTYVDAADSTNNMLLARIVEINNHLVNINFDGWSQKWNSWVHHKKIMPSRTRVKGYTGQKKVAIRNQFCFQPDDLEKNLNKVNQLITTGLEGLSAHDTTQYLSGELFVFVDSVLGETFIDQDILPKIDIFIKAVMRLIVTWLVKIPKMTKTLEEIEAVPLLFIVDPSAAIVECCYELMETLGKFFGADMRALRFFSFYDVDQVDPFQIANEVKMSGSAIFPSSVGVVVQDLTNVDFVSKRYTDDTKYTDLVARNGMKDRKDLQYGQVLNWVQYFAEIGGFDATISLFEMGINDEKATKAPFSLVSQLLRPFKALNLMLTPEFASTFCNRTSEIIVKRMSTLSEQDVKVFNKEMAEQVMLHLNQVLSIGTPSSERSKVVEYTELSIGLRLLKSNYLEKRIKGLQDIRYMIERVLKTQQAAAYNKRQSLNNWNSISIPLENDYDQSKIQTTDFLNTELMWQWLQQNKVLEVIFGQGAHVEIVKRSQPILSFVARCSKGVLDEATVELLWRCQDGKHEEMIRTVYNLIEQVLQHVNLDVVNLFFAKISQEHNYDEKYLLFLRQFTVCALEKQYYQLEEAWQNRQSEDMSEEYSYNFDNYLIKEEKKFIENIETNLISLNQSEQYGLPIFWKICQDGSQQTKEIRELALKSLTDMFKQGFRKTNRLHHMVVALTELLNQKSIVQSAKVIKAAIQSYNIDQNQRTKYQNEEPSLISMLQTRIQFLDKVVILLKNYHELVKQKMKTIDTITLDLEPSSSTAVNDTSAQQIFTGFYSHQRTLKTLLNQIKFLVSDTFVSLGLQNIQSLWNSFVEEPNYLVEREMFLNWINRSKVDYQNNNKIYYEMFTNEEKKFIFIQILCPQATKPNANLHLAKCFNTYFVIINKVEGALKNTTKRFRVLNFNALQGLDALWQISLNSISQKAKDLCQDLLINSYLKLQEPNSELVQQFVDRCMANVDKDGVVSLLSVFLDRYEGIKELIIENDLARRMPGLKPIMIKVQSWLDENNPQIKPVGFTYYQSIGHFRQNIAEVFGVQQNEFVLMLKGQSEIDPEIDDMKFMKDFPGQFSQVSIKRNELYNPKAHPKYLISENQEYFERIFGLFKTSPVDKLDEIYKLFIKLPVNKTLRESFISLQKVNLAKNEDERQAAWTQLIDPTQLFIQLYCVQIINGIIAENEGDNWLKGFISNGGFHQLIKCLINMNITEIDNMLKLKCLKDMIGLIQLLLKDRIYLLDQVPRPILIHKLFDQIELICDFSIRSEIGRGYSFETLLKRIEANRIRKLNLKTLQTNNKVEVKKAEEDDESEDKIIQTTLQKDFKDQCEVVSNMFNVLQLVCSIEPEESIKAICDYPRLLNFLSKGMLQNENPHMRRDIGNKMFDLLFFTLGTGQADSQMNIQHKFTVLSTELTLISYTEKFERRCFEFCENLANLIVSVEPAVLLQLQETALNVIKELTQLIINREIRERITTDQDKLLQGSLLLLKSLLKQFPQQKQLIGNQLLKHLVHDCLFEIPHGGKGDQNQSAPKCKSHPTRQQALSLVNVLSRDCLQNLQFVLDYLSNFNKEATWRTSKETDWNVKLYNDEKSSSGHVGIKNLACICYMNSLNQQLFMIPTFRNDVLSIKDPNHDKQPDEDNMFLQWQTLFMGLLLSEQMYVNPKGYCHALKDYDGNPTNVIVQMDVEEYLAMFLDRLETAIKGTPQAKTIQYHFGGELANEIICKTCPHRYDRGETFLYIGVPVKNKKSIMEGLDAFVQGDVLDEGNQYFCEKCDKKVDALKRTCIKKLPRYMITTFKRFEFDLDQMIRIKVNDMYEFPHQLDMTKYTQEYLTKKAKGGEFLMKYAAEYYNYELVGIVVHSGTADSGHYYSYIKEQERTSEEKWFEFNDIHVRDFDISEIPNETFGGREENIGWGAKGYVKTASAYMVIYKRKMESDPADSDDEETKPAQNTQIEILGQKKLEISLENPIAKKIAKHNQKYWQSRFMFSPEYAEFVKELTGLWNTNFVIAANSIDRNADSHLFQQMGTIPSSFELRPMTIKPANDVSLPLSQLYTPEQLSQQQFNVFKFAAQHYISVMQRADDKTHLPDMIKYLKAHLNYNVIWAQWFLQQFINTDILKECLLENKQKLMRIILAGIIYCAMLKVYEQEKYQLNNYWIDQKTGAQQIRQTVLGNLILLITSMLPKLNFYSKHHGAILQILARFSTLGAEARAFMIQAGLMEKLLNYFHQDCSPYMDEFRSQPRFPFDLNTLPDIGMPTPESSVEKKGAFAMHKWNLRQKNMMVEEPHFNYLIETISNLARSMKNSTGTKTRFMLEQTNFTLTEHDTVLFLPSHEFLDKAFLNATKPRIVSALCKAYMHHAVDDESVIHKLWDTVLYGCEKKEHFRARPYLILFQHLVEFRDDSKIIKDNFDQFMHDFFRKIIGQNIRFFQWMEVALDFVWKLYTRIPHVCHWIQTHQDLWSFLAEWLDKNKEPPMQYAKGMNQVQQSYRMNKTLQGRLNSNRYNKTQNQVLYYYRQTCLNQMRQKINVDLSQEIDLDTACVQDFKLISGMEVDLVEDRFVPTIMPARLMTDLDEIVSLKIISEEGQPEQLTWCLTQKVKIYQHGIIQSLHKYREMQRIGEILQKRAEEEAQKRLKQEQEQAQIRGAAASQNVFTTPQYYQRVVSDEDEDEGEDDDDMGAVQNSGQAASHQYGNAQNVSDNEDDLRADSTEQNFDVDLNDDFDNDYENDVTQR